MPELVAEIPTWQKRPGPFLLQERGKPYSRVNAILGTL
jgi:hypothetical protein